MLDQLAQALGVRRSYASALRRTVPETDLRPVCCERINRLRVQHPVTDDDRADALRWLMRRLRWEHRLADLEQGHAAADDGGPIRPGAVARTATPAMSAHGG